MTEDTVTIPMSTTSGRQRWPGSVARITKKERNRKMNLTISAGNLTDEPKIIETASGKKMARFTLALNRVKDGADFPSFVAWEQKAELLEKWCHKGTKLLVEGHVQTGSYEGKNGKV